VEGGNPEQRMTTLHERIVHMVRQLRMPLLEMSLVVSKYTRILLSAIKVQAESDGEVVPQALSEPFPIIIPEQQESETRFEVEKLLDAVDEERMDILDTLIRTTINDEMISHADALMVMRSWEKDVRERLSLASTPGQLFSPLDIDEDH
jgi:septum formation topological specificity factor MinE|tara:strand:- start:551 stop:997 length:447 start_codon:yes stop_codon:yes gene_type:complete